MSDLHRRAHPARIKRRIQTCWYAHLNPCQIHFNCSGGPFFLKNWVIHSEDSTFEQGQLKVYQTLVTWEKRPALKSDRTCRHLGNDLSQTLNHVSDQEWRQSVMTSLNVTRRKKNPHLTRNNHTLVVSCAWHRKRFPLSRQTLVWCNSNSELPKQMYTFAPERPTDCFKLTGVDCLVFTHPASPPKMSLT